MIVCRLNRREKLGYAISERKRSLSPSTADAVCARRREKRMSIY